MCYRRGGAWRGEGDGDRLKEEEEYVFDGKLATELKNGRRELLTALLFLAATPARSSREGKRACVVQFYRARLKGGD